jgi:hypothetical protein
MNFEIYKMGLKLVLVGFIGVLLTIDLCSVIQQINFVRFNFSNRPTFEAVVKYAFDT